MSGAMSGAMRGTMPVVSREKPGALRDAAGERSGSARGRRLRAWIALVLVLSAGSPAGAARLPAAVSASLRAAEGAYAAGDYQRSIEAYREVLQTGWESASLYYNLGSACHRAGERGWAIAYLEDARRLSPRDPDILHNLALVQREALEGGAPPESSWLLELLARMLDGLTPAGAVGWLLAAFWLASLALAARGWLSGPARRAAARAVLVTLCLLAGAGGLLALKAYQVHSAPAGVIVARQAEVRSGPLESETVRFVVPAGTRVHLGRSTGEWREIRLSGDMRGWVPGESLASLRRPRWWP